MRRMRSTRLLRHRAGRAVAGALALTLAAGGLLATASAASAADAYPASHDPIGAITATRALPASAGFAGGVQVTGWALDTDSPTSNTYLIASVDGVHTVASVTTAVADKTVTAKYHAGATPGFVVAVPVTSGKHTLCMVARNIGHGISRPIGCLALPLGSKPTASQLAAHSPVGAITAYSASASSVRFTGWTTDPDWRGGHLRVVLYIDGSPATTRYTVVHPAPLPAGAGSSSLFDITVAVSSGAHIGCIWAVNSGWGANTYLGCDGVDTRGPAGTAKVTQPALNKAVLAQALTHKGQAYVWGNTGPKSFDCSGLVVYSYRTAVAAMNKTLPKSQQISLTLPRVSEDQAHAARLIPASRAVPGDLVFTHDDEGDVYHVGIYVKPGQAFAAIDTAEGVNYQNIWDPSSTTYGSFTHT
jgi:hypothetical protein